MLLHGNATHSKRRRTTCAAGLSVAAVLTMVSSATALPPKKKAPPKPSGERADARQSNARLGVIVGASPMGGPVVLNVARGSAASEAGIQVGDFVRSVNGKKVGKPRDLRAAIEKMEPGATTEVTVWRNGRERTLDVKLGAANGLADRSRLAEKPWLGIALAGTDEPGAEVVQVYLDGPADEAGIEVGDRIVAVDGKSVDTAEKVVHRLRRSRPGDDVELTVVRDGAKRQIPVTVGSLEDFHERVFGEQFRRKFDDFHRFYDPDFDGIPEAMLRLRRRPVNPERLESVLKQMARRIRKLEERLDDRQSARRKDERTKPGRKDSGKKKPGSRKPEKQESGKEKTGKKPSAKDAGAAKR